LLVSLLQENTKDDKKIGRKGKSVIVFSFQNLTSKKVLQN